MDPGLFYHRVRSAQRELSTRISQRAQRFSALEKVAPDLFQSRAFEALVQNCLAFASEVGEAELKEIGSKRAFDRGVAILLTTPERRFPCSLSIRYFAVPTGDGFMITVSVEVGELRGAIFFEEHPFEFGCEIESDVLPFLEKSLMVAVPKLLETAITSD